jgi:hypothetical protein
MKALEAEKVPKRGTGQGRGGWGGQKGEEIELNCSTIVSI